MREDQPVRRNLAAKDGPDVPVTRGRRGISDEVSQIDGLEEEDGIRCQGTLRWVMPCAGLLIFGLMVVAFTVYHMIGVRFCSGTESSCIPCPGNANCTANAFQCPANYVKSETACIPSSVPENVTALIDIAVNSLRAQAGAYLCRYSERDWLSVQDLEVLVGDPNLFPWVIHHLDNESGIRSRNFREQRLYVSLGTKITWRCALRRAVKKDLSILAVCIAIIAIIVAVMDWIKKSRRMKKAARVIGSEIAHNMKKDRNKEISSFDLKKMLGNNEKLLPYVERELKMSQRIMARYRNNVWYYRHM
jgi:hypothetical protein